MREQRKYEVGAGVRSRDDRLGASGRFGTDRERYNGRNGGQRFRWYSRPVFNRYLSRAGASEASCTERQCMDALAATSDELRKYPMVTDNLTPFAGPQCFPHLDKASTECRLHANQRLKTEEAPPGDGRQPLGPGSGCAPCEPGSWLQCDRCQRWRCVDRACVPALRGHQFFEPADTDLDWQAWLGGAEARYALAERARAGGWLPAGAPGEGEGDPSPESARARSIAIFG